MNRKNLMFVIVIIMVFIVSIINVSAIQRIGGLFEEKSTIGRQSNAGPVNLQSLHKERVVNGISIAYKFDVMSNGDIYEVYGDGTAELRYPQTNLFSTYTGSITNYLQQKCIDVGGGVIYMNHPTYSAGCLATTSSDQAICTGEGYTNPQNCGGGINGGGSGSGSGSGSTSCTFPYSSLQQCISCGYLSNRCTSDGHQQELSYANGVCAYANIGTCGTQQICSDTDQGKTYDAQGTVKGYSGTFYQDNCFTTPYVGVAEYYCDTTKSDGVGTELKQCQYGCSNGACLTGSPLLSNGQSCTTNVVCQSSYCNPSTSKCDIQQNCAQVITKACNPTTKQIKDFPNSCIDNGWTTDLTKCSTTDPCAGKTCGCGTLPACNIQTKGTITINSAPQSVKAGERFEVKSDIKIDSIGVNDCTFGDISNCRFLFELDPTTSPTGYVGTTGTFATISIAPQQSACDGSPYWSSELKYVKPGDSVQAVFGVTASSKQGDYQYQVNIFQDCGKGKLLSSKLITITVTNSDPCVGKTCGCGALPVCPSGPGVCCSSQKLAVDYITTANIQSELSKIDSSFSLNGIFTPFINLAKIFGIITQPLHTQVQDELKAKVGEGIFFWADNQTSCPENFQQQTLAKDQCTTKSSDQAKIVADIGKKYSTGTLDKVSLTQEDYDSSAPSYILKAICNDVSQCPEKSPDTDEQGNKIKYTVKCISTPTIRTGNKDALDATKSWYDIGKNSYSIGSNTYKIEDSGTCRAMPASGGGFLATIGHSVNQTFKTGLDDSTAGLLGIIVGVIFIAVLFSLFK